MQNNYAPPKSTVADVTQSSAGVTNGMVEQLRRTKPWTLFIAILIFIIAVVMMLATGMFFLAAVAIQAMQANEGFGPVIMLIGVLVGVLAVVHFLLGLHLTRFTSAVDRLIQTGAQEDMTDALNRQRKFWVLSALVTVISVLLTAGFYGALIFIPAIKEMMSNFGG